MLFRCIFKIPHFKKETIKRLINPRFSLAERKIYLEKAAIYDKKIEKEQEKFKLRIKLCKVNTKKDFTEYYLNARKIDSRMILLLCSKQYFLFNPKNKINIDKTRNI